MAYDIFPFPSSRNPIIDGGYMSSKRHIIHGFLELDVTEARQLLHSITLPDGKPASFTAFLVASYARAIQLHPKVQAFRDIRGRLIVFHEVDVSTLIEPSPGAAAIPHIIRNAHNRSITDISQEIRRIQANPHPWGKQERAIAIGSRMPRFLRLLYMRIKKLNPEGFKRLVGTTVISSIGMFGIAEKPMAYKGKIALRDCLDLTLSFDHDLVDGAPAARFAQTLSELVENANVLKA